MTWHGFDLLTWVIQIITFVHYWLFEIRLMRTLIQKNSQDRKIEPPNLYILLIQPKKIIFN
jgi:hypothetical protein